MAFRLISPVISTVTRPLTTNRLAVRGGAGRGKPKAMFYVVQVSQNRLTSRILYDWLFMECGDLSPL